MKFRSLLLAGIAAGLSSFASAAVMTFQTAPGSELTMVKNPPRCELTVPVWVKGFPVADREDWKVTVAEGFRAA